MRSPGAPPGGALADLLHHLVLPAAAIGLPLAAMLERLQSQAMSEVVGEPFVLATLARGVPALARRLARRAEGGAAPDCRGLRPDRRHAAQRIVRGRSDHARGRDSGTLMLGALRTRDVYLVAGCAGAGALFLAFGTLVSDVALALVDPRASEAAAEGRARA